MPTSWLRDTRAWMEGNPNGPGIVFAFARCLDYSDYEFTTYRSFLLQLFSFYISGVQSFFSSRKLFRRHINEFDRPVSRMSDALSIAPLTLFCRKLSRKSRYSDITQRRDHVSKSSFFCSRIYTNMTYETFISTSRRYCIALPIWPFGSECYRRTWALCA